MVSGVNPNQPSPVNPLSNISQSASPGVTKGGAAALSTILSQFSQISEQQLFLAGNALGAINQLFFANPKNLNAEDLGNIYQALHMLNQYAVNGTENSKFAQDYPSAWKDCNQFITNPDVTQLYSDLGGYAKGTVSINTVRSDISTVQQDVFYSNMGDNLLKLDYTILSKANNMDQGKLANQLNQLENFATNYLVEQGKIEKAK